jgi:hypothetical protein
LCEASVERVAVAVEAGSRYGPHEACGDGQGVGARTLLITGCDRRYFGLLEGFVSSVVEAGGLEQVDLGFIDIDCGEAERTWLASRFKVVVRPQDAAIAVPARWRADRRYLTSTLRCSLPQYFPGYDIYVYADADVWVQDWSGFELYIRGAASGALTITPQLDRAYRPVSEELSRRDKFYKEIFGERASAKLMHRPYVNGGIFALPAGAPHWGRWAELLENALEKGTSWFGSGQAILSHMVANESLPHQLLPANCNWQCHLALPLWDYDRRRFVEPYLPHEPIRILHLTERTKMQRVDIPTMRGTVIENRPLTYRTYKRLRDAPPDGR